ncbi:MAG: class I SAM-dependent methyltransferase [Acidobacteriota bacterium]
MFSEFQRSTLVRLFWSLRYRGRQPATWLHEELVRRRVNRRISGSEDVWPLDWFGSLLDEHHDGRRFGHGVSLGCGEGALERAVIKQGLCRSMIGLDLSGEAVKSASRQAETAGLESIRYRRADMNHLAFAAADDFDIAFFHQSIHHVEALEHCLETVARALPADGFLYLDEYIGPSRDLWAPELLAAAQAAFEELPSAVKRRHRLELPVDWRDPSEAVRSAEIVPVVSDYFEIIEQRDYGGNLLAVTYPWLDLTGCDPAAHHAVLTSLLDAEDTLLAAGAPSYYTVLVAAPRTAGN